MSNARTALRFYINGKNDDIMYSEAMVKHTVANVNHAA